MAVPETTNCTVMHLDLATSSRLAAGSGEDWLYGWGGEEDTTVYFGQSGSDMFDCQSGVNWIMDFKPGVDQLLLYGEVTDLGGGRTQRESLDDEDVIPFAQEVGEHLRLETPENEVVWLANTQLSDLDGFDVLFVWS